MTNASNEEFPEVTLDMLPPADAAALLLGESPAAIEATLRSLPADAAISIAANLVAQKELDSDLDHSLEPAQGIVGSVGDLMVDVIGELAPSTTVAAGIDYVVRTHPVTSLTYLYIVDEEKHLLGVVAMRDLLLARPGQTLQDIMVPAPFVFAPDTSLPEALKSALAKRHRVYPVVDSSNKLLGMVYSWRLFEYVATELSGQLGATVGLDREERSSTPIWRAFLMRHPWLQVNLLTAFVAAFVVGLFEDTIAQIVVLAVFLPVLAGQSGNTGCQALAITLRSLAIGELEKHSMAQLLRKEVVLGALNGFFVGLVAAAAMYFYSTMTGAADALTLALVVLVAMVGACIGSGLFGVLVPLTLRRFGADPAMASSIFLTTFTDILGMGLMLFLATSLLL